MLVKEKTALDFFKIIGHNECLKTAELMENYLKFKTKTRYVVRRNGNEVICIYHVIYEGEKELICIDNNYDFITVNKEEFNEIEESEHFCLWEKINSEDSLPKENCDVFFVINKKEVLIGKFFKLWNGSVFISNNECYTYRDVSCYKIIEMPEYIV